MASESIDILERTLDQLGSLIDRVGPDQLSDATPCRSWNVAELLDHILADLPPFIEAANGGTADWTVERKSVAPGWAAAFHARANELLSAWGDPARRADAKTDADAQSLQISEFSVHSWDLAAALDRTQDLDQGVAEYAAGRLAAALVPEYRGAEDDGKMFGPIVTVADDAPAYDRLAGIAGRDPHWSRRG